MFLQEPVARSRSRQLSHGLAQSLVFRGAKQALDLADQAIELHWLGVVIVATSLDCLFAIPAMA